MGWLLFPATVAMLCYGLLNMANADGVYMLGGLLMLIVTALALAEGER